MRIQFQINGAHDPVQTTEGVSMTLNVGDISIDDSKVLQRLFPRHEQEIHKLLIVEAVMDRVETI